MKLNLRLTVLNYGASNKSYWFCYFMVGFFFYLYCLLYFKEGKTQLSEQVISACNLHILCFTIFPLIFDSVFEKIIKRCELAEGDHCDQPRGRSLKPQDGWEAVCTHDSIIILSISPFTALDLWQSSHWCQMRLYALIHGEEKALARGIFFFLAPCVTGNWSKSKCSGWGAWHSKLLMQRGTWAPPGEEMWYPVLGWPLTSRLWWPELGSCVTYTACLGVDSAPTARLVRPGHRLGTVHR